MPKVDNFATFWKPKACGQTVLPDKLISIGQNCWKIPMFKNSNETFWVILKQCDSIQDAYRIEKNSK